MTTLFRFLSILFLQTNFNFKSILPNSSSLRLNNNFELKIRRLVVTLSFASSKIIIHLHLHRTETRLFVLINALRNVYRILRADSSMKNNLPLENIGSVLSSFDRCSNPHRDYATVSIHPVKVRYRREGKGPVIHCNWQSVYTHLRLIMPRISSGRTRAPPSCYRRLIDSRLIMSLSLP